jgi:hypothetical protein
MKRLHAFLAALCCAIPFSFAHAQGLGNFVDTANYPIDSTLNNFGIGGSSEQKLAQTLTVDAGGTLEGVFLPIGCDVIAGAGKVHVEIHDVVGGMPGTTVLADRAVAPGEFDAPNGRFTFVKIPGGLALSAGQQVAIVVYQPKVGSCAMRQSPLSVDYPGGHGFFDARPNPPGWVPFSTFAGTSAATSDDLPFILVLS